MASARKTKLSAKGNSSLAAQLSVWDEPTKKARMKTTTDVISRLLWDESLPKKSFLVGYLDRFVGIVEKNFTALDWSDPATVDNYTLALPKHRIQYFKYKTKKVWEKSTRKDIIFGSTGCHISIYDFMQQVDQNELRFMEEDMGHLFIDSDDDCYNNDDDDDSSKDEQTRYESDADRPNFFIAARITDVEIIKNLSEISTYIKSKDPLLGECCIPNETYHVTLAILKLNSTDEITEAIHALNALKRAQVSPAEITLETLDIFRYRVLYSCVKRKEQLLQLREHLVTELTDRKLNVTDKFAFIPHVTIAKISRPVAKIRHSKYIDQCLYQNYEDNYFGSQVITRLSLCEMGDVRREDGFYMCATEVDLLENSN